MFKRLMFLLASAALALSSPLCQAFGEEGHAIVAEIAQRRLDPGPRAAVDTLLGGSMSAVASWPDGVRKDRPETSNWHFVDIKIKDATYSKELHCASSGKGDCIVEELNRLRNELACAPSVDQRRDALRYAIHFLGDIHQPLHTVDDFGGANGVAIAGTLHGTTCPKDGCEFGPKKDRGGNDNLHAFWDSGLIRLGYYDWGSYVDRLEAGLLKDPAIVALGASGEPKDWAEQTHAAAQAVWIDAIKKDADGKSSVDVDDAYVKRAMPVLDRQLALGGLRLAKFLNEAYSRADCAIAPQTNLGLLKAELAKYGTEKTESGRTRYELAQAKVAGDALAYLMSRVGDTSAGKLAIVLDIDETSLDNLPQMKLNDYGYIPKGPCSMEKGHACSSEAWEKDGKAGAIVPTRELVEAARKHGVAVFFVTGRRDTPTERAGTERNLKQAGLGGYQALYLRPETGGPATVAAYKSGKRAEIEGQGYRIVLNMGDQQSDLDGGHAERAFLMPNPFYWIP